LTIYSVAKKIYNQHNYFGDCLYAKHFVISETNSKIFYFSKSEKGGKYDKLTEDYFCAGVLVLRNVYYLLVKLVKVVETPLSHQILCEKVAK